MSEVLSSNELTRWYIAFPFDIAFVNASLARPWKSAFGIAFFPASSAMILKSASTLI
jgi:hypothetical protein